VIEFPPAVLTRFDVRTEFETEQSGMELIGPERSRTDRLEREAPRAPIRRKASKDTDSY